MISTRGKYFMSLSEIFFTLKNILQGLFYILRNISYWKIFSKHYFTFWKIYSNTYFLLCSDDEIKQAGTSFDTEVEMKDNDDDDNTGIDEDDNGNEEYQGNDTRVDEDSNEYSDYNENQHEEEIEEEDIDEDDPRNYQDPWVVFWIYSVFNTPQEKYFTERKIFSLSRSEVVSGDMNVDAEQMRVYNQDMGDDSEVEKEDKNATSDEEENEDYTDHNKKGKMVARSTDDSDSEDDICFDNAEDEKEQIARIKDLNEDVVELGVSKGISDGSRIWHIVAFPKMETWYLTHRFVKENLSFSYEKADKKIPAYVDYLNDHKLRVEYSISNEFVPNRTKSYPETRWYTLIPVSPVNPQKLLEKELKSFSKQFSKLLRHDARPTPGRRFMNFMSNSGDDRILKGCMKYMGDDLAVIEDRVNTELIDFGQKPHKYQFGLTLDKFLPDYDIKKFLQDHLNATSWESVSEKVKKICYKGYPNRPLPAWENIRPWMKLWMRWKHD